MKKAADRVKGRALCPVCDTVVTVIDGLFPRHFGHSGAPRKGEAACEASRWIVETHEWV